MNPSSNKHKESASNMTADMHSNVDPHEIEKFESIASRWWDASSEFKPLHDINPLRLNYIAREASGLEGKRIVDVGCGGGILSESMAIAGAKVLGIDMGELPLKVARLHALEQGVDNIEYRHVSAEILADEQPEQFDVVCCMEMLEHVPDPTAIISACARMCRPGGSLFFSTINRNPKSFLFAIAGAEYVLKMLPRGTHEYAKFIKPSELASATRNAGLRLHNLAGMTYNPLTKHYALNDDVSVNYLVHCIKPEH